MTAQHTDVRNWSKSELELLIQENGFSMRGIDVTRLETFVDAAFAFVLTLLVISFDELPSSYEEIVSAIKRIPAFGASFAVLMMFWIEHRNWSRRFGLENKRTIILSLLLIFVVLVYVYPLRMIFEGLFSQISNGFLPTSYQTDTYQDIRMIFVFYSVGFLAMSAIITMIYIEALKQKVLLMLSTTEQILVIAQIQQHSISIGFGILSILIAFFSPDEFVVLAGYIYFVLFLVMRVPGFFAQKRIKKL